MNLIRNMLLFLMVFVAQAVMDPYKVLEIPRDASDVDIKKAYRRLALKWHPDKNPGNKEKATKKFREVSDAFQILSDKSKRPEADNAGAGGPSGDHFDRHFEQVFKNFETQFRNPFDLFDDFMNDFRDAQGGGGGDPFDRNVVNGFNFNFNFDKVFNFGGQQVHMSTSSRSSSSSSSSYMGPDGQMVQKKVETVSDGNQTVETTTETNSKGTTVTVVTKRKDGSMVTEKTLPDGKKTKVTKEARKLDGTTGVHNVESSEQAHHFKIIHDEL